MSWYTDEVEPTLEESSFGSDYGIEKAVSDKTPIVVSIIGLVAIGARGYAGYKMISHISSEHERLTPRMRGY